MGHNSAELRILLLLDNHHGPETARDQEAADDLRMEIEALINSSDAYSRIARCGVDGP